MGKESEVTWAGICSQASWAEQFLGQKVTPKRGARSRSVQVACSSPLKQVLIQCPTFRDGDSLIILILKT